MFANAYFIEDGSAPNNF